MRWTISSLALCSRGIQALLGPLGLLELLGSLVRWALGERRVSQVPAENG